MAETTAPLRYAAFISYSHANEAEAARLHRALENFRLPKDVTAPEGLPTSRGRIAPVFRDREELSSSSDLSSVIRAALAASSALIVICSPKAKASRWVNEEIKAFKAMHGEGRVYAFLIEGEPADAFPPALLKKIGPDGELTDEIGEPLAADIRPGKDGWKVGTLKIAAGLLHVGLDALRQREAQRERRRLVTWTGVSTAVALAALGLAGWALYMGDVANKERARAEHEAKIANDRADFMVSLFESADRSEMQGKVVTAEEVLNVGVERIERSLKDDPAVQSRLMYAMGRAYTGLGLYGEAARVLSVARQKAIAVGAGAQDQYATESALARALREKGDFEASAALYEKLLGEGGDVDIGDYAFALTGAGETKLYEESPEAAQPYLERARDLLAAHGMAESSEMAETLRVLGGVQTDKGELDAADELLERAKQMFLKTKGDRYYKLYVVESDIAHLRYIQHRIGDAIASVSEAVRLKTLLLGAGHPETIISLNNLARYRFENGDIDEAQKMMAAVLRGFRDVKLDKDPDFAFPLNSAGEIENELGNANAATERFNEALVLAKGNSERLIGPININLGRALCSAGSFEDGLRRVTSGRERLASDYEESDWRYGSADEFESRCRAAANERERARELAKSGYERLLGQLGPDHFFTKRAKKWMEGLVP